MGKLPKAPADVEHYELGAHDLPIALDNGVDTEMPQKIKLIGNLTVLEGKLIGFFCSVRCPGDVILPTYDFVQKLREMEVTIIGGFQSPMEKGCLDLLLRGWAGVVVCPARGIGRMRIPREWKKALDENRLLVLSFFEDAIRRPTANLSAMRNSNIASLSDFLLVPYAERGGKTEELCKKAISGKKKVFTLDSEHNFHLFELGALSIETFSKVFREN